MKFSVFFHKVKGYLGEHLIATGLMNGLKDETYLKLLYLYRKGKRLNLKNPQSYNEKLQWLKINDHNDAYTQMVDKYEAKKYVANQIGDEYIIKTISIWDRFEDIEFDKLPNRFVLKCTHDSGGVVICSDKLTLDKKETSKKLSNRMNINYYYMTREYPYKNIKPKIIAEEYLESDENGLYDYKFLCFHGKAEYVFVCTEREKKDGLRITFFDMDWKRLTFRGEDPVSEIEIAKPKNFEKMRELAEKLAKDIPTVRIDFYENNGKIYFGEITFFHASGFEKYEPEEGDYILGNQLDLTRV